LKKNGANPPSLSTFQPATAKMLMSKLSADSVVSALPLGSVAKIREFRKIKE
jgi:hypothetical protein